MRGLCNAADWAGPLGARAGDLGNLPDGLPGGGVVVVLLALLRRVLLPRGRGPCEGGQRAAPFRRGTARIGRCEELQNWQRPFLSE